jgi:hypothetical protein
MGFSSYNDLVTKYRAGNTYHSQIAKSVATGSLMTAGRWYTTWPWTGNPLTGDYTGSAKTATACNSDTQGAIQHGGDVTPSTKHLLRMCLTFIGASAPATVILYDRLMFYPAIPHSIGTRQDLTNVVTLPRYTTGQNVRAWLEVTTVPGASDGEIQTIPTGAGQGYTNQDGVNGRDFQYPSTSARVNLWGGSRAGSIPYTSSTANKNWLPYLPLQAGDTGMRLVQNVYMATTQTLGVSSLVLGRPLASMYIPWNNVTCEKNFVFDSPSLPKIEDGACLSFLVHLGNTPGATVSMSGDLEFVWG